MSTGAELRDKGVAKVLSAADLKWQSDVLYIIDQLVKRGKAFTAEDVRAAAENCGLPQPHHPNAWGGMLITAARRKTIKRTGNFRRSSRPDRHHGLLTEWIAA